MSLKSTQLGQTKATIVANALTITTNAVTLGFASPNLNNTQNLQGFKLTEWVSIGEVIRPLGINVQATTTFTVVAPIFQLQKAPSSLLGNNTYVSAATGGVAGGGPAPAGLLVAPGSFYYPFTGGTATPTATAPYTFAAADAVGDVWRVLVSTGVTAGVANIILHYVNINVTGISNAVTTL